MGSEFEKFRVNLYGHVVNASEPYIEHFFEDLEQAEGKEKNILNLVQCLAKDTCRNVLIYGAEGSGKTSFVDKLESFLSTRLINIDVMSIKKENDNLFYNKVAELLNDLLWLHSSDFYDICIIKPKNVFINHLEFNKVTQELSIDQIGEKLNLLEIQKNKLKDNPIKFLKNKSCKDINEKYSKYTNDDDYAHYKIGDQIVICEFNNIDEQLLNSNIFKDYIKIKFDPITNLKKEKLLKIINKMTSRCGLFPDESYSPIPNKYYYTQRIRTVEIITEMFIEHKGSLNDINFALCLLNGYSENGQVKFYRNYKGFPRSQRDYSCLRVIETFEDVFTGKIKDILKIYMENKAKKEKEKDLSCGLKSFFIKSLKQVVGYDRS